tara:strand:+ start:22127 stop:22390 length:264 start_codon:yes stop_codon:yes gene_type:complete
MLKRLFIAIIALSATTSIAKASTMHLDHGQMKKLVKMSLWYEGTSEFENSAFRPGAAMELLAEAGDEGSQTPELSEELTIALENLSI